MSLFFPWSKQRVIAVDHGSRCVKLLLAEATPHGFAPVDHRLVDLQEEGLLTAEEVQRHLAGAIREWAGAPLAVALPQTLNISQVVDLPAAGEPDIPKVIEDQTRNLRGLSESALVYEAARLEPFGKFQKPYFITIAREEDVNAHLLRVTAEVKEVRDVCAVAQALLNAQRALQPQVKNSVLVDLGATVTVVAIVRNGQGVFATSVPLGSKAFTEAVAAARKCTAPEAEALGGAEDLFAGAQRVPGLCAAVDRWVQALSKVLGEWRAQTPEGLPAGQSGPTGIMLSGGALQQRGFLSYLQTKSDFAFTAWSDVTSPGRPGLPMGDFVVAYGTAAEAFRRVTDQASLLPPRLRAHRQQLRQLAKINGACLAFLAVTALMLGVGTWEKVSVLTRKRALVQQAEEALRHVQHLNTLARERDQAFSEVWPLLDQQQRTLDALHTLRLLQLARASNDFWCVLSADSESYTRGATVAVTATNRFGLTNAPAGALPAQAGEESALKPGFIVELCVPTPGEQALKVVSDVVAGLKKDPLFSRVDSVPAAQRRALVATNVVIPDRHFAIAVELADLGWRPLLQTLKRSEAGGSLLRRPPSGPRPRPAPAPTPAQVPPSPAS